MNCGLGNLWTLKRQLLAEQLRVGTEYDELLATIGLGVAAHFERFTNRKFTRQEDAEFISGADRDHCFVDRYPVEDLSAVYLKTSHDGGWEELELSSIINSELRVGFFHWGSRLGCSGDSVKLVFTGGYWFDTSSDNTEPQPSGSFNLPDDLRFAWILQCREVWINTDKLGLGIARESKDQFSYAKLDLSPQVRDILHGYRRFYMA